MKENLHFIKKCHVLRSMSILLCLFLLGGHITGSFAQGSAGNTISFNSSNSTMLFSDLPTTQSGQQKYSCYIRHSQAPIQILNANPTGPTSGTNTYSIAPLQSAEGTGFFANSSLANNMGFSEDGRVQFYHYTSQNSGWPGSPYKYICFAVIAPKGYRFTEYWMDIDGSQNNGADGCTIMRYTYDDNSTIAYTQCEGETLALTAATSQIFSHTLSNAENLLYFRIEVSDEMYNNSTMLCATMNQMRFKYEVDGETVVSIPNNSSDGLSVHTGYIDFGELTDHTAAGQYFFNKTNVSDLETINIVPEDASAQVSVSNGKISVSEGGTYWIESPAKFRILEATMNFEVTEGSTVTYVNRGTDLQSILGKPVKISDGNGNYLVVTRDGSAATNATSASSATTWIITKADDNGNYYIKNESGSYLLRNSNGNLTTGTTQFTWEYYSSYSSSNVSSTYCFIYHASNRDYGIRCNNGSWAASRTDRTANIPTPLNYFEVVTSADDYTASLYGTDATTAVATADLSSDNTSATLEATGLNNDGIKFTVSGPAAFSLSFKIIPLDPDLQHLEFGYKQDGVVTGDFISASAIDYMFNGGNPIVIPLVPGDGTGGAGNGDSHQIVFRGAYNENRTPWYDGTGSGDKTSNYYLVGSQYEINGSNTNAPSDKVDADQAGTAVMPFSNLGDLTSSGGRLTETEFSKTAAAYQDIVISDGGEQTVYIYSADHPVYMIMSDAGKANREHHTEYTFYSALIQTQDIELSDPVITVTPIYTSSIKGDNVKVPVYNQAMGTSVSVPKDTGLDEDHVFYGVTVTTPEGGSGYTTSEAILNAIKAEFSKSEYSGKVYAGDVMRTILYVDMHTLKAISGSFDSWKEIMLGTADNCLFYNPAGFDITQTMIGGGLIAGGGTEGGTAVTDIVINDQQPFFAPWSIYTSTHVAHYHRAQVNGKELPKNTTLMLPFRVLLSPEGYLKTSSDNVNENVKFYNMATPTEGESNQFGQKTYSVVPVAVTDGYAAANTPYHVTCDEQRGPTSFVIEVSGANIPPTPTTANAFTNSENGMVGHGSLNGVAINKEEGIFYFSKEYFWNSSTLADGKKVMLLPYRAYYTTNDATINALNKFGVDFDAEFTTAINDVESESVINGIYDLTGRRIATDDFNSLPRGLYIVNGKKIYKR